MMSRTVKALALAAMVSALPAAHAVEQVFQFTGHVISSSFSGAAIGDAVTGTFRYDLDALPVHDHQSSDGAHFGIYSFNAPGSVLFEAKVGSYTAKASHLSVDVVDNFNGNVEDTVSLSGSSATINGEARDSFSLGLFVGSGPGKTGVFSGIKLPASYDLAAFDAVGGNYGTLQTGGGQADERLFFQLTSVTAVPEPGVTGMALVGMMAMGFFARGRRVK